MRRKRPDSSSCSKTPWMSAAFGAGFGIERDPLHDRADLLQRLEVPAVVEPGVPGPDPADSIGLHAAVEQPDTCVHGCLSRADYRVARRLSRLATGRSLMGTIRGVPEPLRRGASWVAGIDGSR